MSYTTYKNYITTPAEYIDKIPDSWKLTRNKNLFMKNKNIVGQIWNKYPVLSLTKEGVIIKDIEKNEGKMPSDFGTYQIIEPGNLLLCLFDIDVTPRCVGYIKNKGIISGAYSHITPITDINMKYYYYWYLMLDNTKELLHLSKNLRNSLSNENFMDLYIVQPTLEEQEQIAKYLDTKTTKIEQTITKNKKLITLLKEKRKSLINQTVTKGLNKKINFKYNKKGWNDKIPENWEVLKLNKICDIKTGGTPSKNNLEYWDNGTINWMTSGEVNQKNITKTKNLITKEGLNNSNANVLPKHSIMMALSGQGKTKGTVAILEIETCCSQSLAALIPNKNMFYKYLFYYLESNYKNIRGLVGDNLRDGLSITIIKDIYVLLPSITEQKQIAEFLEKETKIIDKTIEKIEKNIELLEEYKESLIHHVVTGKIDVRGVEV